MRNLAALFILLTLVFVLSCKKEDDEPVLTPYQMLTGHVWTADTLLANGAPAGGPGQMLEKFNGDVEFRTDGTGTFGQYTGTWTLSADNKEVTIVSPDLTVPVVALIAELTKTSLKITTTFTLQTSPPQSVPIRMTFIPKS